MFRSALYKAILNDLGLFFDMLLLPERSLAASVDFSEGGNMPESGRVCMLKKESSSHFFKFTWPTLSKLQFSATLIFFYI